MTWTVTPSGEIHCSAEIELSETRRCTERFFLFYSALNHVMPKRSLYLSAVMAGLVPAIHASGYRKAWMPGTRPGMTAFDMVRVKFMLRCRPRATWTAHGGSCSRQIILIFRALLRLHPAWSKSSG
jgi:hypothetical protein